MLQIPHDADSLILPRQCVCSMLPSLRLASRSALQRTTRARTCKVSSMVRCSCIPRAAPVLVATSLQHHQNDRLGFHSAAILDPATAMLKAALKRRLCCRTRLAALWSALRAERHQTCGPLSAHLCAARCKPPRHVRARLLSRRCSPPCRRASPLLA